MKKSDLQKRNNHTEIKAMIRLAILLALLGFAGIGGRAAMAQTDPLLNFTGKVTNLDGTEVADGAYDFSFSVYASPGGGTAVWSETLASTTRFAATVDSIIVLATSTRVDYSAASATTTLRAGQYLSAAGASEAALIVDYDAAGSYLFLSGDQSALSAGTAISNRPFVEGGVISENLGTVSALSAVDFSQPLYLEVVFNGETMRPRKLLAYAPAAFDALRFGGKTASQYAVLDEDEVISGEWSFTNALSVATSSSAAALSVAQDGSGSIVEFSSLGLTRFAVLNDGRVQIGDYYLPASRSGASAGYILKTDAGGNLYWAQDFVGNFGVDGRTLWATSSDDLFIYPIDSAYTVVIGNNATSTLAGQIFEVQGSSLFDTVSISDRQELRLYDQGSAHYIALRASATLATSLVLTLPDSYGAPNSALVTDGAGNLRWDTPSSFVYASPGQAGQLAYYGESGSTVSGTSSLFISSQGYVGIGTATPDALLAVGGIYGSQFTVDAYGRVSGGIWQGSVIGQAYGGIGTSSAGWTGLPFVSGGNWAATGTLRAAYGGTGQSAYAVGDILYADSAGNLAKLGIGGTGQLLMVSGGVPSWAATTSLGVDISEISGVLPVNQGGTGQNFSGADGFIFLDNGTAMASSVVQVAYGGTGQTSWTADRLLYASGAHTLDTLNKGANNTVFYIDADGNYSWTATSSWDTYRSEQDIINFGFIKGLTLGNLYDVSTSSLASGHVLYWDGLGWQTTGTSTWDTDTFLADPDIAAFGFIKGLTLGNLWDVSTSSLVANNILYWDGGEWKVTATSTWTHDAVTFISNENYLSLSGQEITVGEIDISEHTNLAVTATGLALNNDTIGLSIDYIIPLSASTSEWSDFYTDPSLRIVNGSHLTWTGNRLDVDDDWWDSLDDMLLADGFVYTGFGGATVATSAIFIDTGLNYIGIGTTTPDSLLHVDGRATFDEICLNGSCASNLGAFGLGTSGITNGQPAVFLDGSNLTSTSSINVAYGGTGRQSLADGALLLGAGAGPISTLSVANPGEIVIGTGAGGPSVLAAFTAATGALKTQYGGIGTSSSAWLGVAFVQNGEWMATSALSIAYGGTGADNASSARANLGIKGVYEYGIDSAAPDGYVWMSDGNGRGAWVATSSLGISGAARMSIFIGTTTEYFSGHFATGTLEGYAAANYICAYYFPGSHFCRTYDILVTAELEDTSGWGGEAWVAEGPPGFTSDSNDCNGWTTDSATKYGAWWQFTPNGGLGWLIYCNFQKQIACCSRQ